jgi:hypothetical protein
MKFSKRVFASAAILAVLMFGILATTVFSPPPTLKLKAKWKPATLILDSYVPNPWYAEIYFAPPRDLSTVDTSSLLLEGLYAPTGAVTYHPLKDRLVVPFAGDDVLSAIMSKLHMAPGIYVIFLEITGTLNDGTAFRGQGSITVTYPEFPPP